MYNTQQLLAASRHKEHTKYTNRYISCSRIAPHPQLSGKTSDIRPPYSPDLDPAHIFLFPKHRTTLKGCRFQTIEEIQENAIRELRAITGSAFQGALQRWEKHWERCIAST
jgi:hypothetical protein